MEKVIASLPIDYPKLLPDDWDKWWSIWNSFSKPLEKTGNTPNSRPGLHVGFDVHRSNVFSPNYSAPYLDLSKLYPSLFEQIMSLPINIYGARFVKSNGNFPPHIDNFVPSWSLRNMFYCNDPEPQWYYTDRNDNNIQYLKLPDETNWWAYRDGIIKHGTTYREEYPKIILQIFSHRQSTEKFVLKSVGKFLKETIYYDIGD